MAGIRAFTERHRVALALTAAVPAAGLAVLWLFVVPAKAAATEGVQSLAIRYGHPLAWAALSALALLVGAGAPGWARGAAAWLALAAYVAFLLGVAF